MIYPPNLALVNPIACNAHQMDFLKERILRDRVDVEPGTSEKAIEHNLDTGIKEAYYLGGFQITPLEGPLPKGRLRVVVDGDEILREDLAEFVQNPELTKHPWPNPWRCLFPAAPINLKDGYAIHRSQLGYFLPNGSRLRVYVHLEEPIGKAALEVATLGADYKVKGLWIPLLEPNEAKA